MVKKLLAVSKTENQKAKWEQKLKAISFRLRANS